MNTDELSTFTVTPDAERPGGRKGACCYCQQPFGSFHKASCVLVKRTVVIRMTTTYEVSVPADWGREEFDFFYNDGSSCANNALLDIQSYHKKQGSCMCDASEFEVVEMKPDIHLSEK